MVKGCRNEDKMGKNTGLMENERGEERNVAMHAKGKKTADLEEK